MCDSLGLSDGPCVSPLRRWALAGAVGMGQLGLHHTPGLLGSPIHWLLRNTFIQGSLGVPGKDLEREGEGKAGQRTESRKQKAEVRRKRAKG